MANTTELPNPFTPLVFLPPAPATEIEVAPYLFAATVGAYIWDIALNLGNDYALLFKHRISWSTMVYFLSRVFTFAYTLTSFVFQVGSVQDCDTLELAVGICLLLSQSTTAMLFLLRALAVWQPNKIAYVASLLLWLGVTGADILAPLGLRGAHVGPTMQCMITAVPANVEWVPIMALINDTAVFCAINYRIIGFTIVANSSKDRIRAFLAGRQLSKLSGALIRGGQHFYLIAVCTNILLLVVVRLPSGPPVFHVMLAAPGYTLINAMACLVYREIKFGFLTSDGAVSTLNFQSTPRHRRPAIGPQSVSIEFDVRAQTETVQFEGGTDGGEMVIEGGGKFKGAESV
ncbi:hypothetical protein K438DRAFT_1942873 [Mycena galopus ATCC 62051]|nr:hypothetical protein K438DRAFT_1942873 [Mycena galopus ATCC 62051]